MKRNNRGRKSKALEAMESIDQELFEYIQPKGGITFKEPNYILTGDGYIRVLHLYQLPKALDDFWLDHVFNMDDTIATIDICTRESAEVKKNINRSLKEEFAKEHAAKDFLELYNAQQRQKELEMLLHELSSIGEIVKMVDFRIFVHGRNLVELDDRCETILRNLEGDSFLAATLLNEGKREWQSLFEPYRIQHAKPMYMSAHPLTTEQLAIGYPFDYSELIDEYGDLLGFTPVGGTVVFNEFTKTKARKHYNALVCGNMGSGKSTLLKKRFKSNAAAGNFIRTFDVTGEFALLTREFGGRIIRCDGSEGLLNPLEILRAGDDDHTSYARHISKVMTFFKCILPGMSENSMMTLGNLLREFYEEHELTPAEGRSITGLPAKRYPIFTDFLQYLGRQIQALKEARPQGEVELELMKNRVRGLAEIVEAVKNVVQNYGNMFDGHTSVDNIVDEKIVTFDISQIKDFGSVFVAQMFNMVSLCWDNAVSNGKIMKELWESGNAAFDDITCFLILIDESHRWVNTSMPQILDLLIKYLREGRKYFAGIYFASQSMRDFMPQGENSPHVDLLRTLFELTQYKFIFQLDSSILPSLNRVFNNELTYSQIQQIPYLNVKETILSISGDRSLRFSVWRSEEYEAPLFDGGR